MPNSEVLQDIVTKELKIKPENYNELSIAEKNSRLTRIVLRTHNDFHKHKFWEICLVLKGKGKNYFLNESYDMYAGTMWLLRPDDVHKIVPFVLSFGAESEEVAELTRHLRKLYHG